MTSVTRTGLGAETRPCTVSFTNMTGYVGIAESMPLERLPVFLNRFLETHCEVIHSKGGTIVQFIGDVIMACWSEPKENAQLACESALDQVAAMNDFYAWAMDNGYPCPSFRIGINSGEMLFRAGHTVVGEWVNLASRLEHANKDYGTRILISEFTREQLSPDIVVRPIDQLSVGTARPLKIYELLCRSKDLLAPQAAFLDAYSRGVAQYFDRNVAEALRSFEQAQQMAPDDVPTKLFVSRCRDDRQ